jgi:hypothetical protein
MIATLATALPATRAIVDAATPLDTVQRAIDKIAPPYPTIPGKKLCICQNATYPFVGYLNTLVLGSTVTEFEIVCAYSGYRADGSIGLTGNCTQFEMVK